MQRRPGDRGNTEERISGLELTEALLSIGLLIVTAKLLEGVFKRFGLNAIVAYATAGVLMGPLTGLAHPGPSLEIILGIGIFMLFFLIGLEELDIKGFVAAARGRILVAAVLSVTISLLAALAVTTDTVIDLELGLEFTHALGLAGVLSLSSLGVVAKVLVDEGRVNDRVGVQIFTVVILAELVALFVVGFSISEHIHISGSNPGLDALEVLLLIGQILAFAAVTWLVSTKLLPRVIVWLQRFLRVPQLSFGLLLGSLFLVVVAAERAGLHGSLGALLFGAALSTLPYQVRRDIMPGMRGTAEGFFVPLFFASAGLYLSPDFLELPPQTIVALVFLPLFGKFLGSIFGAYVTRLEAPFATATGLMAKGVAEVALLLLLLQTGAINQAVFSLLALVMLGYMLITPLGISFSVRRLKTPKQAVPIGQIPSSFGRFALEGIQVDDILDRSRGHADKAMSVKTFAEHYLLPEQNDYVIVDEGQVAGMVSLSMLRYLPRTEWEDTPLDRVLRDQVVFAYSDEYVEDVLQRMTESSVTTLPVAERESEKFIGSIASTEVLEMIVDSARGHEI